MPKQAKILSSRRNKIIINGIINNIAFVDIIKHNRGGFISIDYNETLNSIIKYNLSCSAAK